MLIKLGEQQSIFSSYLSYIKALFIIIFNIWSQLDIGPVIARKSVADWICWWFSGLYFLIDSFPFTVFLIAPTMKEDEFTMTEKQFTCPQMRHRFPWMEQLQQVYWPTKLLCPNGHLPFPLAMTYFCHPVFCSLGTKRIIAHNNGILSQLHVCACTFASTHQITWIHKDAFTGIHTNMQRLGEKYSDKHKYRVATFNRYKKNTCKYTHPCPLSHRHTQPSNTHTHTLTMWLSCRTMEYI